MKQQRPPLILDVGPHDAIRVIDAHTKTLMASDWLPEVTATPSMYRAGDDNNPSYTQPLLAVHVPDMEPLRIGPSPMGRWWGRPAFRYGWHGTVRGYKEPTHEVTEADWLALVDKFGFSAQLIDETTSGKVRQIRRRMVMTWPEWVPPLIFAAWLIHHFVR